MSKLENILTGFANGVAGTAKVHEVAQSRVAGFDVEVAIQAKQQIKDLMLELVNECDPSPTSLNDRYWGNELRQKVEEL